MTPELLLEKYTQWAQGLARSVARRLPPSFDVEDISQAALIALWKCCQEFDRERGVEFLAYAHVRVQMACWMSIRRREYTERTHAELPAIERLAASTTHEEEERRELRERLEALQEALWRLRPAERRLIVAHYIDGVPMAVIAERLRTSPSTAGMRVRQAFRTLQVEMGREVEDVGTDAITETAA